MDVDDHLILRGPSNSHKVFAQSVGFRLYQNLKQYAQNDCDAFLDVTTNETISYKDLFEISCKVAIKLRELGYAGKNIAVCSENRLDFFIPVISGLYLGSPIATISNGYTKREILHACELVKPVFVFCSKASFISLNALRNQEPMEYLQELWTLENLSKFISGKVDILNFSPLNVNTKDHAAALFFSSGTTGLPKAVMTTHHNLNVVHAKVFDKNHVLSTLENTLVFMPFYHVFGFNVALALLVQGIRIKYMVKFDHEVFLSSIEKYKLDCLAVVPPVMVYLAKHPLVDKYDLSSVKTIICGAAICSPELETAVLTRFNNVPTFYQAYGQTESTASLISTPVGAPQKVGSVGKVDAGVEIKIRNPETNKTLGPHEVGEICARGDTVMKGYSGNDQATRETITSDKWLLTGDLGYYDDEGYFFIVDRLKEIIKFKGFQVPPAELEALLVSHPKIMDAGVVGLPDDAAGELPLAYVVRKPGVQLDEQEVKDFIKGQVSYPKQLHGGVRFIDDIPKNGTGKILRRELRDLLKKPMLMKE